MVSQYLTPRASRLSKLLQFLPLTNHVDIVSCRPSFPHFEAQQALTTPTFTITICFRLSSTSLNPYNRAPLPSIIQPSPAISLAPLRHALHGCCTLCHFLSFKNQSLSVGLATFPKMPMRTTSTSSRCRWRRDAHQFLSTYQLTPSPRACPRHSKTGNNGNGNSIGHSHTACIATFLGEIKPEKS